MSRIAAAGREARDEVSHRRVDVGDVVQHRPGGDEVEGARVDRPGDDVGLSQLEVRRPHVHERQVEVDGDGSPARADLFGEPRRDGAVAAPDLERPRSIGHPERLEVAAVHRVEQPRHQRQSRALALEVMVQHVPGHGVDRTSPDATRQPAQSRNSARSRFVVNTSPIAIITT